MTRNERLQADYEALALLRQASTILDVQPQGEPPDRYVISFRGQGACRAGAQRGGVELVTLHKCEIRLPAGYPAQPPDIRWLTPLVHPNVSYSGFLSWREIGIQWHPDITLDVICERLWDVVRWSYVNTSEVLNHPAQRWQEERRDQSLPLDSRPLRDIMPAANPNIIRYAHRDGRSLVLPTATPEAEILFIGDDTPAPSQLRDDDILYIDE